MAKTFASDYTKTYTSFSGCDIVATFGNTVIGELQALTYSIQRQKAPIYTMGSAEPRSFSRGKRGIAGSLVFTVFDRDALLEDLKDINIQRIGGEETEVYEGATLRIEEWDSKLTGMSQEGSNDNSVSSQAENVTKKIAAVSNPHYDDEIPPFDITVSFANEYGQRAVLVIYGVEILNEGTGFSIDNVTTEKACTFVARRVEHMKAVEGMNQTSTGNASH